MFLLQFFYRSSIFEVKFYFSKVIRSTGKRAAVAGKSSPNSHLGSAVAQFVQTDVKGAVYFTQLTDEDCQIDVTLTTKIPGQKFALAIHQFGDFSDGFARLGDIFDFPVENSEGKVPVGFLGFCVSDTSGQLQIELTHNVNVNTLYGRSLCVYKTSERTNGSIGLGCDRDDLLNLKKESVIAGVMIVRCSGVYQNSKRICACDGTTLWEASFF
eukprot:TRINITY_DN2919_c0_g1_i1.p1 TRINITY_DN2919_c0_g1~~TRINITY_DN2919_c0_g1_i1.p1  ORF type:complete len:213 (-),score=28.97 TRINITY_DN2919_c0_g1_i1:176-814(-)